MEELKDIEITCIDCITPFIFTVSEQRYFKDRQLFQPKRCPKCREIRKARVRSQQQPMLEPQPVEDSVDVLLGSPPYRHRKADWYHGEGGHHGSNE
jgi:hypothetical protein